MVVYWQFSNARPGPPNIGVVHWDGGQQWEGCKDAAIFPRLDLLYHLILLAKMICQAAVAEREARYKTGDLSQTGYGKDGRTPFVPFPFGRASLRWKSNATCRERLSRHESPRRSREGHDSLRALFKGLNGAPKH